MIRLQTRVHTLHTMHPFVIARGGESEYRTVVVTLTDDEGIEGWGEAASS